MTSKAKKGGVLDPILSLPAPSIVNSLCFVEPSQNTDSSDDKLAISLSGNSDSDEDVDDGIQFRSSSLYQTQNSLGKSPPSEILKNRFLVTSQQESGEALLWDLRLQKQKAIISSPRGGKGLCVRRTESPSRLLFQTRDPKGTVSLHALDRSSDNAPSSSIIRQFETYSQSFCAATPCVGDCHLLALPSEDSSEVVVVDDRADEPVATYSMESRHGMVLSLALIHNRQSTDVVCCGMEDGNIVCWDIAMGPTSSSSMGVYSLGKQPILTLDACGSTAPSGNEATSLLLAAGMAGDADEIANLDSSEAGRVVMVKVNYDNNGSRSGSTESWQFQQRARLSTCRVDDCSSGKPGVAICRFRPGDGRLLAVGGCDYRIRLYERSKGTPMAILKGNGGSVSAIDWAPDASTSGLMASAGRDNKVISIWQCYNDRRQQQQPPP